MTQKTSKPQDGNIPLILVQPVKMSWFSLALAPYRYFVDSFTPFLKIAAVYSVIFGLLAIAFGFPYLCTLSPLEANLHCSSSAILYIIYSLIRFFLISCFIVQYQKIIRGEPLVWKSLCRISKTDLKTFGVLTAFILLFIFPLLSFYILYVRVPNPDWQLELLFFAAVSTGFLVPVLAVRFYSVLAFAALGEKIPDLRLIWRKSSGNLPKILFSIFLMLLFFVFFFINLLSGFRGWENGNYLYTAAVSEFLYNMVFFMFISWITGLCYIQKILMFGETTNEQ